MNVLFVLLSVYIRRGGEWIVFVFGFPQTNEAVTNEETESSRGVGQDLEGISPTSTAELKMCTEIFII